MKLSEAQRIVAKHNADLAKEEQRLRKQEQAAAQERFEDTVRCGFCHITTRELRKKNKRVTEKGVLSLGTLDWHMGNNDGPEHGTVKSVLVCEMCWDKALALIPDESAHGA